MTSGIISALGRSDGSADSYQDFIQTDAPINPGNSGGALVNLQGQLVGINTAIFSGSGGNIGIGFAIPSNMVKAVMTQLVQYGEVKRGMLGVQLSNQFTPDIAKSLGLDNARGALVSEVVEGGAADKAGIKAGDVITSINGKTIANSTRAAQQHRPAAHRRQSRARPAARRQAATRDCGHRRALRHRAPTRRRRFIRRSKALRSRTPRTAAAWSCKRSRPAARRRRPDCARTTSSSASAASAIANIEQLRAAVKGAESFAITIQRGRSRLVFPVG